ncbi:hypothetical protein WBJ53_11075 [Spirosoma sp. SC4-14]|uniref:hypothetical protein n=1 Tax=Spirosoma sp. SC4-14 TaxID=3128900 RepID=UPI0030CE9292
MINNITLSGARAKGPRPYSLGDRSLEDALNIIMALAGELAVVRERLDTLERLLEQKGVVLPEEVDQFVPTYDQEKKRQQWQADYIARILRIVQQELEAIQQPTLNNSNMKEILEELGISQEID